MLAKAPGKLVISGAYAVLRGAPALVTAVDRYVVADDSQTSSFETPEVSEGLKLLASKSAHPAFDATHLREADRKLGLGSSAAICASSLALIWRRLNNIDSSNLSDRELADAIYDTVFFAHRQAQGGGSGIDVAAACFGGTLGAQINNDEQRTLHLENAELPASLVVETWAAPSAASTAQFVKKVFALEQEQPAFFEKRMGAQIEASRAAQAAAQQGRARAFVDSLREQVAALTALGEAAGLPIVLPDVQKLHSSLDESACFLPSGAGGGDITLHIAEQASSSEFRNQAKSMNMQLVPLKVGARGLHFSEN